MDCVDSLCNDLSNLNINKKYYIGSSMITNKNKKSLYLNLQLYTHIISVDDDLINSLDDTNIGHMIGLHTLDISNNWLYGPSLVINRLTSINTLILSNVGIEIFKNLNLSNCTNLENLDISNNEIAEVSFGLNHTPLKVLDVSHTYVNDYSFIRQLDYLREIFIRGMVIRGDQINNFRGIEKINS